MCLAFTGALTDIRSNVDFIVDSFDWKYFHVFRDGK